MFPSHSLFSVKTSFEIENHQPLIRPRPRLLKPLLKSEVKHHRAKLLKVSAAQKNGPISQECSTRERIVTPLPPPLLESMDLSSGVTVKEGTRSKQGEKV